MPWMAVGPLCLMCVFIGAMGGVTLRNHILAIEVEDCRREHNIYACTLQAVPVAQPSWASNGESK